MMSSTFCLVVLFTVWRKVLQIFRKYFAMLTNNFKVMGRSRCDDYSDAVQKRIIDMASDLGKETTLFVLGQL